MRWILVLILLYIVPLTVLFRNYKNFRRACIYGCTYIVLSTTIVISNIYISGLKKIENTISYENYAQEGSYRKVYVSNFEKEEVQKSDLEKICDFKEEIYNTEKIALLPMRKCIPYTKDIDENVKDIDKAKKEITYSIKMCNDAIKSYDNMDIPKLSDENYTKVLQEAKLEVKQAYELRAKAMENTEKLIQTKDTHYILKIAEDLDLADKKIENFKEKISRLQEQIKFN